MKITYYGHSILIAMIGVMVIETTNTIGFSLFGGFIIGIALRLARKSGEENI
jgi:hypothetical protein